MRPATSCSLPTRVACMAGSTRSSWRTGPELNRSVWKVLPVADGTEDLEKYIASAKKARSARCFMTFNDRIRMNSLEPFEKGHLSSNARQVAGAQPGEAVRTRSFPSPHPQGALCEKLSRQL